MTKKKGPKGKPDEGALIIAESFVRGALEALSNKRVSDATVRSVAKKVLRAIPAR
jgi:hypothetical protein